jgi:hypothetical protein
MTNLSVVAAGGDAAFTALLDEECRRWEDSCRYVGVGDQYPWASQESRELVSSVLRCLFDEDPGMPDSAARSWAATNITLSILARRLGCLSELLGEEGVINGRESVARLQRVLDGVTNIATEAGVARWDSTPATAVDTVAVEAPTEVGTSDATELVPLESAPATYQDAVSPTSSIEVVASDVSPPAHSTRRAGVRRRIIVAVALFTAALVGVVLYLLLGVSHSATTNHSRRPQNHGTVVKPQADRSSTTSAGQQSTSAQPAASGANGSSSGSVAGGGTSSTTPSNGATTTAPPTTPSGGTPITVPPSILPGGSPVTLPSAPSLPGGTTPTIP